MAYLWRERKNMVVKENSGASELGYPPKRALVVLPTYNEKENIAALVGEILALRVPLEVLVVDDNSPDGTAEIVAQLVASDQRVHLLRRAGKLGLGTAYKAGFSYGLENGYDAVITMDADFSHHPRYLPAMLAAAANYDLVIGSRYVEGGGVENWPWHRQFLSAGANLMSRLLLGLPARDCTAGFRCYRSRLLQGTDWEAVKAEGYGFLEEMLYRIQRAGFTIGEVPIVFADRKAGSSKISKAEIFKAMAMLFRLGMARVFKMKPAKKS
jgi:dolichol-phosphate mannosyltransferase